ncbi:MAG: PqqD family peptide modification chaperone [Legionellales bacterium]
MDDTNINNPTQQAELVSLSEREGLLRAQPGFTDLGFSDMGKLVGLMHEVHVETGNIIVKEGDLIDSVYILATGDAEVTHEVVVNKKTGVTLLATLHACDSIGLKEGRFFSETGFRSATVTAISPCLLLKLHLSDLNLFLKTRPELLDSIHTKSAWMLRMRMLKQAAPFAKLSPQQLAGLASGVKELTFAPEHSLFKQGDPADACYLICSGKVEITVSNEAAEEKVVAVLEPYSLLGEAAFLSHSKRNATAKTLTESTLLLMDKDVLLELASSEYNVPDSLMSLIEGHCRPVRHDNVVHQHRTTSDGLQITTLKNSTNSTYFQLSEVGWFIWSQMNGDVTLAEIARRVFKQFGKSNTVEEKHIVQQLVDAGFASIDINEPVSSVAKSSNEKSSSVLAQILRLSYFFKKADKKVGMLYNYGGFLLYTIPLVLIQILLVGAGMCFFYKALPNIIDNLKSFQNLPYWLIPVVVISMTYQLIVPLMKALAIKHFEHEVPQFGIMWNKIGPVGIVDTSDMWLGARWPQIAVCLSGMLSNAVIASLLSLYAYYNANPDSQVFTWLCALIIYFQSIRSLNPMLDLDGYELLTLLLDRPQIRELSMQWILRKPKASKHHWQELVYWGYTLLYLVLIVVVTGLLLSVFLNSYSAIAIYIRPVLIGVACIFIMEIVLEIQNQMRTSQTV